ncbi:MAG: 23S rRNA (adenine(2503)-C(2))-methyltransferase RlmN [Phycisphaerae bacterium]|mgnify:CR=1 FL=1|nr:23S rRNA (adenine(2503)-C(2))-methyltransferase RlmN [Phycisphaerae bacterium]|tara:strand:+ start:2410 stop:3483 length:1074 start_codon:yes stop_codon:yes gene_type:complete
MPEPTHIFECTPSDLRDLMDELRLKPFVADQLLKWVYGHGVTDLDQMTNLSESTRDRLREAMDFTRGTVVTRQDASDGTRKILVEWDAPASSLPLIDDPAARDRRTETVMIPTDRRRTACVSSQIGCPVGCTFCASGIGGLDRNLTAGQIVEQVHHLQQLPDADRITNIVFMGMGEPLANASAVFDAVRILNASWAYGIGARRITISTVGLPAAIRKLEHFDIPVTLALSLHAPNDKLRRQLIPWAEYSTIDELLDACDTWFQKTGREVTLEYILLGGVNDRSDHAEELAHVARSMRANVNLIRYNEVDGLPHRRPDDQSVRSFQRILRNGGVNVHIRASRGRDIAAACGQLRHEST